MSFTALSHINANLPQLKFHQIRLRLRPFESSVDSPLQFFFGLCYLTNRIYKEDAMNKKHKGEPVAQRQEMVIGTLALLSWLLDGSSFVSRAAAPEGGQSPVEYRGNLCIRLYIPPFICLPLEAKSSTRSSKRPELVSGRLEVVSRRFEPANERPQQNWVT